MTKILIADDEEDVRLMLKQKLTNAGYEVVSVNSGADAVVAATTDQFDLLIVDMLMPEMDGIKTIKVLRKVTPDLPIIGLTGYVGYGYMSQAQALGVITLPKPVAISELLRLVKQKLDASKHQEAEEDQK